MLRRFVFLALLYPVTVGATIAILALAVPGMAERPHTALPGAEHAVLAQPSAACPVLAEKPASRCPVLAAAASGCPGARAMVSSRASAGKCPALAPAERPATPRCPGLAGAPPTPRIQTETPPGGCPFGGSAPAPRPDGLLTAEMDAHADGVNPAA